LFFRFWNVNVILKAWSILTFLAVPKRFKTVSEVPGSQNVVKNDHISSWITINVLEPKRSRFTIESLWSSMPFLITGFLWSFYLVKIFLTKLEDFINLFFYLKGKWLFWRLGKFRHQIWPDFIVNDSNKHLKQKIIIIIILRRKSLRYVLYIV